MSELDSVGYAFTFGNRCFILFRHNNIIGSGILSNILYKLKLDNVFVESLLTFHYNVGTKRDLVNESSTYLWHKRISHISKVRIKRLVKNEILLDLDIIDLDICVDCIKRKQANIISKKEATKSTQLIEIIYTDISRPYDVPSFGGKKNLSPLLMIFHIMIIFICCMKNLNQWMPYMYLSMRLKDN